MNKISKMIVGSLLLGAISFGTAVAAPVANIARSTVAESSINQMNLDGIRVIEPNGAVYLVIDGKRRWIPCEETYNSLFANWEGIRRDIDPNTIPLGEPLPFSTSLIIARGTAPVYLWITPEKSGMPSVKHHISSEAAFAKWNFDWNKVRELPGYMVDAIPLGAPLS